ncbi:hypothetical protein BDZ97DRAFT_1916041 [Flammula alnicola]|nr:hypothetical protein BDZ97DRAFT_1916041 [Flammula alnicola]
MRMLNYELGVGMNTIIDMKWPRSAVRVPYPTPSHGSLQNYQFGDGSASQMQTQEDPFVVLLDIASLFTSIPPLHIPTSTSTPSSRSLASSIDLSMILHGHLLVQRSSQRLVGDAGPGDRAGSIPRWNRAFRLRLHPSWVVVRRSSLQYLKYIDNLRARCLLLTSFDYQVTVEPGAPS